MNRLEALKNSVLFKGLSESDLASLAPIFSEKEIEEGKTVFVENMPGESLYLIARGSIRISRMMAEGDEKILVVLGPEDLFGEMAILEGAPRSATARVAETAHLLGIKRKDFETLCEENPKLGIKLMRNVIHSFSQRLRENNEEYREMLIWALGKQV